MTYRIEVWAVGPFHNRKYQALGTIGGETDVGKEWDTPEEAAGELVDKHQALRGALALGWLEVETKY